MSPRAIPEALRPLPIRVRPHPAETVASYVMRLARANHLLPSYLHAYLCGPPNWHGAADLERLAVLCGRPLAVLQRALTGAAPTLPSRAPQPPSATATPSRPRELAASNGHHDQTPRTDTAPAVPTSHPAPDGMPPPTGGWLDHLVDRKVWGTGVIGYAGAHYSVGRPFVGQTVQVGCADGMVHILHGGQPLRTWPRRHPEANEVSHPAAPTTAARSTSIRPTASRRWTTSLATRGWSTGWSTRPGRCRSPAATTWPAATLPARSSRSAAPAASSRSSTAASWCAPGSRSTPPSRSSACISVPTSSSAPPTPGH
jgi:hypothetical protein